MYRFFLRSCAALVAASLAQLCIATSSLAQPEDITLVTPQPDPSPDVTPFYRDWTKGEEPRLSRDQTIALLRAAVKYVFVIFNENESFDHDFGTFPGANGIYSDGRHPRSSKNTPGFTQTYQSLGSGETVSVEPFLIGPSENANVFDSVDHSHIGLARKLHVFANTAAMDQFALDEYSRFAAKGGAANEAQGTQFARLVMSHIDCDTIPFFWQYASRFVLFDNIFATEDTPSTPNTVAMIAGQAGETQWVKHGPNGRSFAVGNNSGTTQGPPLVTDAQPFYGSQFDTARTNREPAGTREPYKDDNIATNLTFATLTLTFQGRDAKAAMSQDLDWGYDLPGFFQARTGTLSLGAGIRKATISSRPTPVPPPRMIATSAITRLRNISAISRITPRLRAICAASATSSPAWRRARFRRTAAFFTSVAALPISPSKCLMSVPERPPPRPRRSRR